MLSLPHALSVLVILVCLKATQCKRAEFWQTKKVILSCDRHGRVALVEHFFSIIFTEFRKNPPVCVCVQMCENQATYCYPNGCLLVKPNEVNSGQTMHTQSTDHIDNQFVSTRESPKPSTVAAMNHVQTSMAHPNSKPATEESMSHDKKQSDFDDNYKRIFKSKISHKVGLRYVAEAPNYVKNGYQAPGTLEALDMSKTRWPAAQPKSTEISKTTMEIVEEPEKVKKFFLPTFNEETETDSMSQNFKRNTLLSDEYEESKENLSAST